MDSTATTPVAAAAHGGFFSHHGFWAPGVRLFRRMSFPGKACVISAVFLIVVAQLGYMFLQGSLQTSRHSQREIHGLVLLRDLLPLFESAQGLRGTLLASDGKLPEAALRQRDEVQAALQRFAGRVVGSGYAEPTKFALQALEPLTATVVAEDGEDAFKKADEFVQQLQRLMVSVADLSGLSMDPEFASYHLTIAATQETPAAISMLARVRDLGAQAMARKEATAFEQRLIAGDTYVLYRQLEALFARYERVVKARPDLEAGLAFQQAFDPVNAFVRGWRRGALARTGPTGDPATFVQEGDVALAGLLGLTRRSHDVLGGMLQQREQVAAQKRAVQVGVVLAGVLVAAYLFYSFFLVTRGGMREVTRHIEAMAQGDLTTVPQPWGTDEAAGVMHAVHRMQVKLRALIGQVRGCADDIATASAEVSGGAEDLSVRTESTAAQLQQTASTMDGIAASVRDNAQRVGESAAQGRAAAAAAQRSREAIGSVVTRMHEIEASARRVGEILGVIDSIAFQTNILALNAAVEAARAGEQGRGFAVVAGEVRQLAQRSGQSAKDIRALLGGSVQATDHGVKSVHEASSTMDELAAAVQSISALLQDISSAAGKQTRDIGEVSGSVSRLDDDTQRNAALVEQTTSASQAMRAKADQLTELAARFTLPLGHV